MHTIEISAHARITLPCLALHAPLPPLAPWYELITRLLPVFFFLPALSNPPPYTSTGNGHWSSFFSSLASPPSLHVVQLSTAATIAYVVAPHLICVAPQLHLST
ncbi:hypothetical protein V8C43DRAFT_277338 [Trichoderma afarasin]